MTNGELFKKVYGALYQAHIDLYHDAEEDTLLGTIKDEATDTGIESEQAEGVRMIIDSYLEYSMKSSAAGITRLLCDLFPNELHVEDDVDLSDYGTIDRITGEVIQEIEG